MKQLFVSALKHAFVLQPKIKIVDVESKKI